MYTSIFSVTETTPNAPFKCREFMGRHFSFLDLTIHQKESTPQAVYQCSSVKYLGNILFYRREMERTPQVVHSFFPLQDIGRVRGTHEQKRKNHDKEDREAFERP
jgi:hypothetical protein